MVTGAGSGMGRAFAERFAAAGMNVVLLVTEPYANFSVVRERARRLGLRAYQTASEDDLTRLQAVSSGPVGVVA